MSDYDGIGEMRDLGICSVPEGNTYEITNRKVEKDPLEVFFKEVKKCPRLNPREESEIGEKMKKEKIKEMIWCEKLSQLNFERGSVSNGLSGTLDSIRVVRNPAQLDKHRDELFQLIQECDREKLKEYWLALEKVKKEINKFAKVLVISHLRLVIHIAKKYKDYGLDFLDLIQEGNLGLIKATQCWEHQINTSFSTYATWWIRQRIIKALSQQSRTIRRPVYLEERIRKMIKTRSKLMQDFEKEPSPEETAKDMNLPLKKIEKIFEVPMIRYLSLSAPINGSTTELGMLIEDKKTENPLEKAMDQVIKEEVEKTLSVLTLKEKSIIELRFGMGEENYDHTLEEIGLKYHFTRERTRQIEKKALRKLRCPLRHFL